MILSALLFAAAPLQQDGWSPVATFTSERASALLRFVDVDGEAGDELLHVAADGTLELLRWSTQGGFTAVGPPRTLREPERSLLTLVDLLDIGTPQLVVLDGEGLRVHELGPEGIAEASSLSRRARLLPRTAVPAFADFVRDVGDDGLPDVVVPTFEACELWLASAPEAGNGAVEAGAAPTLRKVATLEVPHVSDRDFQNERLSDVLTSQLILPDLTTEDVNGDGREDLVVSSGSTRAFHLQAADGTFPAEPSIAINLGLFRDTSPRPDVRPGEIVASDRRSDTRRDLDGDGIPDHVIAHRRKVWVFHGTAEGPQFRDPSTVLKVAEDVTGLAVLPVDDDERPDLVLLKVELPGIAELVVGVVGEWEVSLRVIGYKNQDGRSFSTSPTWKEEHRLKLPPIMDVLRNPERFLASFEEVEASVRGAARGDLDGDGRADLVLIKADGKQARPWLGVWSGRGQAGRESDLAGDAELRELLFESEDTTWDLDRLASTLASLTGARLETLTGGRDPDARTDARDPSEHELVDIAAADVDGDGRDEAVLLYVHPDRPRLVLLEALRAPR